MTARRIAEIISLDNQDRSVNFRQSGTISSPHYVEHQNENNPLQTAAKTINKLFLELQACFPAWRQTFTSRAEIDAAKRSWARGLFEAKITTQKQLDWGLAKARRSESPFWPSLGQFIKWCQPDPTEFGLPDTRKAYLEACRNAHCISDMTTEEWSHPAVYVALKNTGAFDIRSRTEAETWPIFERNYEIAVRRVLYGEDLNKEFPKSISSQPVPRPVKPEVAKQHIERLKRMLKSCK
ncbi:replication protein P [Vibrio cholerae]|uniref:replication protein P n=1 Tax=Vibrio TaxID=662 RepID=UPI001A3163AA|nr:replication protein P [Vibrio sp. 2033]EGR0569911.1 replication protein P [Vibrio cholerae]MDW2124533.1 replication protein P [Vibrio sp. 2033]HAT8529937.1 replication protein P [Vibrio vulnificus]